VPRHVARLVTRLVVYYFTYAARPVASARRAACRVTHRRLLRLTQARHRILRLRRAFGCLGTSRSSSRGSSSTTSPRASSSSTTSPTPRVRVPRHIARLVTWLVVDYFTYAARPVASAHHTACRVTHRRLLRLAQARHRLLRLRRASGCLGTSHGSSRGLVVDYFDYAARPIASARRAARRLLRLAQAHRRLLHLCRASGCFGMARSLSCDSTSTTSPRAGSSSTTSPTPRVRVPRHIARLVTRLVVDYFTSRRLVVDYFTYAARPVASARRAACRVTHR
jgi:hypothetical protein